MTKILGLSTVELEVNSRCNRACPYCPVSILPVPKAPRYIDRVVLSRVLAELREIEFDGRFSFHFYNEPLLNKDLEEIVRQVRAALPAAKLTLYTNGDLLTEDRYHALIEAGIDLLFVTSHSLKVHPERPKQEVHFPKELTLTNRGGILTDLPGPSAETLAAPCFAPAEMLIVTVTGEVVQCYEDARRENVMGNLVTQSLHEIWHGEEFVRLRHALAAGNRAGAAAICQKCSNTAHAVAGRSHVSEP
jgi:2-deoxy-scyllo-inosamine dehydrogenase (SAM-dependent)